MSERFKSALRPKEHVFARKRDSLDCARSRSRFRGRGYKCENMPTPIVADFQGGVRSSAIAAMPSNYFRAGNLVR